jgi:hypothetical protein
MRFKQSRSVAALAFLPILALGACQIAPPTGPSITALPGPGKPFPQFQKDDDYCRSYAANRNAGAGQEAANQANNSNATAVAGTLIGAGLGAALGSLGGNVGAGAAVGAGAGLLTGASVGGANAQNSEDSLQGRYDTSYAQCMVGYGNTIESEPPPYAYAPPPPGYYDAPPPPPGYYAPY